MDVPTTWAGLVWLWAVVFAGASSAAAARLRHDPGKLRGGQLAAGEDAQAGVQAFPIGANEVGVDRNLVEQPIVVDPGFDEKAGGGHRHVRSAAGVVEGLGVASDVAAIAARAVQRLRPRRDGGRGLHERCDDGIRSMA